MRFRNTLMMAAAQGGGRIMPVTTWNPLDKGATVTLSNGNLTATETSALWKQVRSTTSKTDKRYFEMTSTTTTAGIGVANATLDLQNFWNPTTNAAFYLNDGNVYYNGVGTGIGTYVAGDVLGCAVDPVAGTVKFNKNGGAFSVDVSIPGVGGTVFACATLNNGVGTVNFGATAFVSAIPSGYVAWDS